MTNYTNKQATTCVQQACTETNDELQTNVTGIINNTYHLIVCIEPNDINVKKNPKMRDGPNK